MKQTVATAVEDFERRLSAGEPAKLKLGVKHLELALAQLGRNGFKLAHDCLDRIANPEAREIVRTVLMSAAGGAALGMATFIPFGPKAMVVGGAVGGAIGAAAGVFAVLLTLREEHGPNGSLVVIEAQPR